MARAACPSLEGSQVSLASSWSRSRACTKHTYGLSNSTSRYPRLLPTPSKITACCLLKRLAMRVFPSTRSERAWGGGTCPWAAGLRGGAVCGRVVLSAGAGQGREEARVDSVLARCEFRLGSNALAGAGNSGAFQNFPPPPLSPIHTH